MPPPRVLHVGVQPIGAPSNTGLTLGTMFGRWPPELLLQVCQEPLPQVTPASRVIAVPPSAAPVDVMLRKTVGSQWRQRRIMLSGKPIPESTGLNNSISSPGRLPLRARLRRAVTAVNDIGPVRLPSALVGSVEEFRPQVVHSLLGGVRTMRLALALARRLDVPIVPHFMDDWVATLFTDGQLGGVARHETQRVLGEVLERSPLCLVIGEDMRAEFETRLGRECIVVGNSVEVQDYVKQPGPAAASTGGELVMRYVGGLHLGRDEVIASLATHLDNAVLRDRQWRLELFVPGTDAGRAQRLAARHRSVRHEGHLEPDAVPAALCGAHALVFLESGAPEIAAFTRLSLSTKVPQYLASRRPVLAMGPADQGSIRVLARQARCVYAGDSSPTTNLTEPLARLTGVVLDGRPLGGSKLSAEFDARVVQQRLETGLTRAATMEPATGRHS